MPPFPRPSSPFPPLSLFILSRQLHHQGRRHAGAFPPPSLRRNSKHMNIAAASINTPPFSEDAYLETWFRSKIKSFAFYENEGLKKRNWFFSVDLQGRLYAENRQIKNITSCVKDTKFMNFFFRQVRKNDTGLHTEYPFVSPCGKEMNYILSADVPIVFHDLLPASPSPTKNTDTHPHTPTHEGEEEDKVLIYAGDMIQPFDPASVFISMRTGRLYHPLTTLPPPSPTPIRRAKDGEQGGERGEEKEVKIKQRIRSLSLSPPVLPKYGLLRSHVGLLLSDAITHTHTHTHIQGEGGGGEEEEEMLVIEWKGVKYPVRELPVEEEPLWGLPPS